MTTFPLNSFQENLLPKYPGYHISHNGTLYRKGCEGWPVWLTKKPIITKYVGAMYTVSLPNSNKWRRVSAAELLLIAYGKDFDEEKLILFRDSNPLNLELSNIYQPKEKDRYLIKYTLESFPENLKDLCDGYSITTDGRLFSRKNKGNSKLENFWTELKMTISKAGRATFSIIKNKRRTTAFAHVLIAHAFIGPRPRGLFVCHNDGNALNNKIDNLRYDTPKSNCLDRIKHGTMLYGEDAPNSSFKNEQIELIIKEFIETNISSREITKKYGISYSGLNHILRGRARKNAIRTKDELKVIDLKLSMYGKKLKKENILDIFKARKNGETIKNIASSYGVNYQLIYLILKRKIWKKVEIPSELI